MSVRYLSKFTSIDGLVEYVWPVKRYEYESQQPLRNDFSILAGADYALDHLASVPSPKEVAQERVRFLHTGSIASMESSLDTMRSKLYSIGRGKLWVIASDASLRWAYGRLAQMPEMTITVDQAGVFTPSILAFNRFSDWFGSALITGSVTLNEVAENFTINNTGNAPVLGAFFKLFGTFSNPKLFNDTNNQGIESSRDGTSVNHILEINCARPSVRFSSDNGVVFVGDFALINRMPGQVGFMRLEPGNNSFVYQNNGVPNATLEYSFYPAFH